MSWCAPSRPVIKLGHLPSPHRGFAWQVAVCAERRVCASPAPRWRRGAFPAKPLYRTTPFRPRRGPPWSLVALPILVPGSQ